MSMFLFMVAAFMARDRDERERKEHRQRMAEKPVVYSDYRAKIRRSDLCEYPDDPCTDKAPVQGIECDSCVRWNMRRPR